MQEISPGDIFEITTKAPCAVPAMHDRHVCKGTRGSVLHTFVFDFSANAKEASQSSLQRIAVDIMIGSHALSSPLKPRIFCALRPCLLADLPVCFCICNLKYTTFFPRLNSVFCKNKRKINNKNGEARQKHAWQALSLLYVLSFFFRCFVFLL